MKKNGSLIVISGPSGSGKGTIVDKLLQDENIELSISCTTRDRRKGEEEGVSYYFIEKEEFDRMAKGGEFLEHAQLFDHSYGTPRKKVEEKLAEGKNVILEIDVQGAMQVKKNYKDAVMIFIMPPSLEELTRRLINRGTETDDQIGKRIKKATVEMALADEYGYTVINDNLDDAVQEVRDIINKEEHLV